MRNKLSKAARILREEGPVELFGKTANHYHSRLNRETAELVLRYLRPKSIDTDTLQDEVANRTFCYTDEETFEIKPHQNGREVPEEIEPYLRKYETERLFVSEVSDTIIHEEGIALTADGKVIFDTMGNEYLFAGRIKDRIGKPETSLLKALSRRSYRELIPEPENEIPVGFFLVRRGSYFHWITEFLPNLRALEAYEEATGMEIPIIVRPNPPEWILEYMSIAGVRERVVPMPSESVYVETLVVPPRRIRIGRDYNPCTSDLRWVKERFGGAVSNQLKPDSGRIYVSREDASTRHVSNEEELVDELSDLGFRSYRLSEMSVPEQIGLFTEAEFVVGAHGAGLANIVFSEDIDMLEILPDTEVRHFYYCMARQLGFDYDYYLAETDLVGDIEVDADEVRERVEELL